MTHKEERTIGVLKLFAVVVAIIAMAVSFTSCSKQELRCDVELSVRCESCAIQWRDGDGTMHADTMYGDINYTHVNGETCADTVPGWTAGYHIVLRDGQVPYLSACNLYGRIDSITVAATGDVVATVTSTNCAAL